MKRDTNNENRAGLIAAVLAQTLWGLLPVYWKWMADLAPYQILVHRVVWSFVFLQIVLFTRGKNHVRALLRDPTHRKTSLAGGVLVSINCRMVLCFSADCAVHPRKKPCARFAA